MAQHPRWSIYAEVVPSRARLRCSWNALNISKSGVFIAGEPLLKRGSQIDVLLHLPGAFGPTVEVTARIEVIWNRSPMESSDTRPAGMGCRFIAISDSSQAALDLYIDELGEHRPSDSGGYPQPETSVQAPPPPLNAMRDSPPPPPPPDVDNGVIQLNDIVPRAKPLPVANPASTPLAASPASSPTPLAASPAPSPTPMAQAREPIRIEAFYDEPLPGDNGAHLGPYRLLEQLGTGGMGDVFLAQHRLLGRRVAIKRLHEQFARDPIAVRRFFDEARLVNQISHPNIVEITDLVCEGQSLYYVMELIEGSTLLETIRNSKGLELKRVADIGLQLADALQAVHDAGIIHRDLKPDNVLLTQRHGHRDHVKLLDFGIAKLRSAHEGGKNRTLVGFVVGTPGYMAPEQIMGQRLDSRTDLYALGILLYEMITGRRAFGGKSAGELMIKQASQVPAAPRLSDGGRIPPVLEDVVVACLQIEADKRPSSAAEIIDALRVVREELDPRAQAR